MGPGICDINPVEKRGFMKNILLKKVTSKLHELKNDILEVLFVPFWNR